MMIPININNSADMHGIVEDCAGAATPRAGDRMACPRGILEHIFDFFTLGAVRRENAKAYDEFAQAMTVALQHTSLDTRNAAIPEWLVVAFSGYTVIFTQPGQHHNAANQVTIEVRQPGETTTARVNKGTFRRISTALLLRRLGGLPSTAVVLTDDNRIDLQKANLTGASLSEANLDGANLSEANLRGANLSGANLTGADLFNTNLRGADLVGANLGGANLSEANLKGADLCGANLNRANLSNILQEGALLKLPEWNSIILDAYLNHINNPESGSLLTMMDSIDEQYADVKLRMARELMTSLQNTTADTSSVALPLMDILSKAPYTDDADITAWLVTLCGRYLSQHNGLVTPRRMGIFNLSVDLFTRQPERMFTHNGTFIQIIAQGMAKYSTPAMKEKAAGLYETYLRDGRIKAYSTLEDFGNGEGKPDWSDKHAVNFILLSAQPARVCAMLLSLASLEGMLRPQSGTEWHNVYLYKDGVNLSPAESPPSGELFAKAFPLFNDPYQHMQNSAKFLLLLKALNLGSLETPFVSAAGATHSATKLVSATHQKTLKGIFAPKLTYSPGAGRYGLNDAHYEELLGAYGLASASDGEKGKTLLCLAALFTKYSSSAVFGTETESPEVLSQYAYALMAKAHSLDGSLVNAATFANWTNRLLGLNKAFTCSAVLSNLMVEHIRSRFPAVLWGIMPPAWG